MSKRAVAGELPEEPYEGLPLHLRGHVDEWLTSAISYDEDVEQISLRLKREISWEPSRSSRGRFSYSPWMRMKILIPQDAEDVILDVLDAVLIHRSETYRKSTGYPFERDTAPEELEELLKAGGSAYTVSSERTHLERRVDPTARKSFENAVAAAHATSASNHLSEAWRAIYGRSPDAAKSYGEAIKAVEAAAIPIIQPNHARATLGTVRGELKANPTKWTFQISPGSIDPVLALISTLWDGQVNRHGGVAPTAPISERAAESAVHLAVTLVQWFASGAVRQAP
ncbi:hypothetical protein I7331_03985 [Frankia sp. AgB1.8]|nr:hypothetical protein [Frankia sp. AgB1.8]